jgi:hypothetical protein
MSVVILCIGIQSSYGVYRVPVFYDISSRRDVHDKPISELRGSAAGSCDPCARQGGPTQRYQVPQEPGSGLLST